jgi:diguanylate cyclase (GGDEF)-like protein
MREYIGIAFLTNMISLLRAGTDGAIWLTDDEEEARFYERCAHPNARVVAAPGFAERLLELADSHRIKGIVATVCRGKAANCANDQVFRLSVGDVASLLLISSGFEQALNDIGGEPWLMACQKEIGSILQRSVGIACVVAGLRTACSNEGLDPPDFGDFVTAVNWETFEADWDSLRSILLNTGLSDAAIKKLSGADCGGDVRTTILRCDGADVVRLLSTATMHFRPRSIGAREQIQYAQFLARLRAVFHLEDFEKDEAFWRMRRWERQNAKYPLLKEWRVLDSLGVLWDQRYWQGDLAAMLQLLAPTETLAAFKMDLDNFKQVNEARGHGVGDEAIRLFCQTVKKVLGKVGEVYRRGGDEIVAFAANCDAATTQALAEEVRASVEREFMLWGRDQMLDSVPTASIGVVIGAAASSPADIVMAMDEAQRLAKHQGKNRVIFVQLGT